MTTALTEQQLFDYLSKNLSIHISEHTEFGPSTAIKVELRLKEPSKDGFYWKNVTISSDQITLTREN